MMDHLDLDRIFTYHSPNDDQADRYQLIRAQCRETAYLIVRNTKLSREQSIAIRKIEEACMWANAAIARNE